MNQNSPVRLRDQFRAATHRAILDAAENVFAKGIANARMEDIAAEAGVSVGTLYNHFADRQALLEAVIETRHAEMQAIMDETLKRIINRAFEDQLEYFMQTVLKSVDQHYEFFLATSQEESRLYAPSRHSMLLDLQKYTETLVHEGVKSGTLRKDDAELYSLVIVGMIRGVSRLIATKAINKPVENLTAGLVRCFMEGAIRR